MDQQTHARRRARFVGLAFLVGAVIGVAAAAVFIPPRGASRNRHARSASMVTGRANRAAASTSQGAADTQAVQNVVRQWGLATSATQQCALMTDHFKAVLTGADPANCVNNLQMGSATHFASINVTLEGDRASALAINSNQTVRYTLVKSGGSWLIDGQGNPGPGQPSSSSGSGGGSSPSGQSSNSSGGGGSSPSGQPSNSSGGGGSSPSGQSPNSSGNGGSSPSGQPSNSSGGGGSSNSSGGGSSSP